MSDHTPGCTYQARCLTCGWTSGIGDSDNAHDQAWDHRVATRVVGWADDDDDETPIYTHHTTEKIEITHDERTR